MRSECKRTCKCRCKRRSHVRCKHKQAPIRKRSQSLLELSHGGMERMEPVFMLDCLCVCVVLVHTSKMQTQAQMKGHICVTVVHTSISWSLRLRLRYGGSHVYFLAFAFAEQVWTEHNSPTIIFRSLSRSSHKLKRTSLSSKISFNFTSYSYFSVQFKTKLQAEMSHLVEEFMQRTKKIKQRLGEKHRQEILKFWKLQRKGSTTNNWLRISQVSPHPSEVIVTDFNCWNSFRSG